MTVCNEYCFFQLRTSKNNVKTEEQLSDLRNQMEQSQTEVKSAQSEVDRLLELLKDTENEKNEKDNQLKELQELVYLHDDKILKEQQQPICDKTRLRFLSSRLTVSET